MTKQLLAQAHFSGVGVGLRSCHYSHILKHKPALPWFEVLSDNYLHPRSIPTDHLLKIRQHYPMSMHGVGLSIGASEPLNFYYLDKLKNLAKQIEPLLISDHLCWISSGTHYMHELLPLPYTEAALKHVVQRIQQVQDYLGCRIALENVSSYFMWKQPELSEWEFIKQVALQADCSILLDVNNIYVSAFNHGFDALDYLKGVPADRVVQYHLAGYQDNQTYLLDSHSEAVHPPVWDLFRQTLDIVGVRPTLIEWDEKIPPFETLYQQAQLAERVIHEAT